MPVLVPVIENTGMYYTGKVLQITVVRVAEQ